jgi:hypothetical protein
VAAEAGGVGRNQANSTGNFSGPSAADGPLCLSRAACSTGDLADINPKRKRASKGTVPFSLTRKSGQSPRSRFGLVCEWSKAELARHAEKWYNTGMTDFGKGPTLAEANPWLRDEAERIERILDVTERNSVIEGLPPLSDAMRERLRMELTAGSGLARAPGE